MATFTVAVGVIIPVGLGSLLMEATNPEVVRVEELRGKLNMDSRVMARLNKERLAVLLEEVKNKDTSQERYASSLNGQTLGTKSSTSAPEE